jgi:hypothetical protein
LPSICSPAFFAVDDWSGFRAHDPDVPPEAGEPAVFDEPADVDAPPEEPGGFDDPDDPEDEQAVRTRAVAVAATATAARLGILMAPKVLQAHNRTVRM